MAIGGSIEVTNILHDHQVEKTGPSINLFSTDQNMPRDTPAMTSVGRSLVV